MAQSAKKSAQEILDRLPEDADWEQIMYELYVNQKIEQGLKAAAEGRVISHEEVKRQLLGNAD
jgi:predicted transcriptional regulator